MSRLLAASALAASIHLVVGCGQTGPLYLPQEAPPPAETAGASGGKASEPS